MERFEYKPDIRYTRTEQESIPREDILADEAVLHLYDLTIKEVWDHIDQLLDDTNKLVSKIEANVGTAVTRLNHPEIWETLDDLKQKYGDQSPSEHMSFAMYKRIFTSEDPYDQMVAAAFESEHAGIDGLVEVEAYPLAVDMHNEAQMLARLTKNTALNITDSSVSVKTDNNAVRDIVQQRIFKLEQDRMKEVLDIQSRLAAIQRKLETNELTEEPPEYKTLTSKLSLMIDQEQTLSELKDVVNGCVDQTQIATDSMSSVLFEPPFRSDKRDLVKHMLRSDKITANTENIQDLCELLCAEKTDEVRQGRAQLTGTTIPRMSLEQSLSAMSHYRNKIAAPAANWLDDLTVETIEGNIPAREALDELSGVFSKGLAFAEQEYRESLMGLKGLSESTARLRQMCIHALQEKQQTRQAHKLISEMNQQFAQSKDQGALVRWADNL